MAKGETALPLTYVEHGSPVFDEKFLHMLAGAIRRQIEEKEQEQAKNVEPPRDHEQHPNTGG
jgi:hypothetical protein